MKKQAAKFLTQFFNGQSGPIVKIAQMLGSSESALDELKDLAHGDSDELYSLEELTKFYPDLKQVLRELEGPIGQAKVASLSEVFKFKGQNNKYFAIKVKLPDIRKEVESQLHKLGLLRHVEKLRNPNRRFGVEKYLSEISASLDKELDYKNEKDNLIRFYKNNRHRESLNLPRLIEPTNSEDFIVMTYLDGIRASEVRGKADQQYYAKELFTLYLQQFFMDGFIQGDTHSGNFLFSEKINMIDFGHCLEISEKEKKALWELMNNLNPKNIAGQLIALGFDQEKLQLISTKLLMLKEVFLEPLYNQSAYNLKDWKLKKSIQYILGDEKWIFRTAGSSRFFMLIRSFMGLFKVIGQLNVEVPFRHLILDFAKGYNPPQLQLPIVYFAQEPKSHENKKLLIRVIEGNSIKVNLQLNVKSLISIEDMLSQKLLAEIQSKSVNLEKLKKMAYKIDLQPHTLLDFKEKDKHYLVKIIEK